jgi:hypothetical protein
VRLLYFKNVVYTFPAIASEAEQALIVRRDENPFHESILLPISENYAVVRIFDGDHDHGDNFARCYGPFIAPEVAAFFFGFWHTVTSMSLHHHQLFRQAQRSILYANRVKIDANCVNSAG